MRCQQCGGRIGVYEPLVLVADGEVRESSAAAEPGVASHDGQRFHSDCWRATAIGQYPSTERIDLLAPGARPA